MSNPMRDQMLTTMLNQMEERLASKIVSVSNETESRLAVKIESACEAVESRLDSRLGKLEREVRQVRTELGRYVFAAASRCLI